MITKRPAGDRGHVNHGWLDTFHTFSFGDYHDPNHMGWSALRVLNEDRIEPGRGFDTHGHRDMEIVTYVMRGAIEHRDSMGNGPIIRPGEVQLMSAGTGVTNSEYNASEGMTSMLQMWIVPERRGTEPRYDQRAFAADERRGRLRVVVSADGRDGSLVIGQDAALYVASLDGD